MRQALERMPPLGLRWRLAAWVAVVVLVATAITFVAVYRGTATQLRNQIDSELAGDGDDLAHNLRATGDASPREVAQSAARYIDGQPFKPSSELLFASVPGVGTASNRAELFSGARPDPGEQAAEQRREQLLSAQLLSAGHGYSTLTVPDVGELRLLKRAVRTPGGLLVSVGVAEPLAPVAHAQSSVASAFVLASVLALAGALLAAYLIGTSMSRPLRRMAAVAARVDAGELHPRIGEEGGHDQEVRVLADAFDHMLDRLSEAFDGQRAFVADASHELRTPLTVIRGQIEVLAAQRSPSADDVRRAERHVQAEIARITRLIDDLLLLARSEHTAFLRPEPVDLQRHVRELWGGVVLMAERRFELGTIPAGTLQADPDRLAQALRNLLANAIQHTAEGDGLVRLRVEALAGQRVRFSVEDDGPGIPRAQRERVFARFYRLDDARDRASGGTGLGLAIVRAIADAHRGSVAAGASPEGGACMALELPRFEVRDRAPVAAALAQDAGVADRVAAGLGPDA